MLKQITSYLVDWYPFEPKKKTSLFPTLDISWTMNLLELHNVGTHLSTINYISKHYATWYVALSEFFYQCNSLN